MNGSGELVAHQDTDDGEWALSRRGFVAACAVGLAVPWVREGVQAKEVPELAGELYYQSAASLVQAIRLKKVSSLEVVDACIKRTESVNSKINALVQPAFDQARAAARKADQALARGTSLGPLHGVPFSIKD